MDEHVAGLPRAKNMVILNEKLKKLLVERLKAIDS
jgi:hypothetical protein